MASFFAIPTLAGQAAITAAMDGGPAIVLSEMVVGDGNGNAVTPLESQTALVNPRATVPLTAIDHTSNRLTADAILDETIGGFTIREAGLLDGDGVLLFVGSVPATQKMMISEGVEDVLTLGMIVVVSDTASVTLSTIGVTYASHDYVNEQIAALRTSIVSPLRVYHIAVKSMALAAPPVSPTPGDVYLVAADATGLWAGHSGKLAQYISSGAGWQFVVPHAAHVISDEATGLLYQRNGSGVYTVIIPPYVGTARSWLYEQEVAGVRSRGWANPRVLTDLAAMTLTSAIQLPTFNVGTGLPGKTTVDDLAKLVAASNVGRMFFYGE